jgi:hypothetical protein
MLDRIRRNGSLQLFIGLLIGIVFGFLLQKGGVTHYDIILGQLLLTDHTVIKIILSAVVVGMLGVYAMKHLGLVQLHVKPGSFGSTVIGGLIFGAAFAILGYCPGTVAGAVGQGALDALFGGVIGMLIGAGLFAAAYERLQKTILSKGDFGQPTLPDLLGVNDWVAVIPAALIITAFLWWLESQGM